MTSAEERASLRVTCELVAEASKGSYDRLIPTPTSLLVELLDAADALEQLVPEALRMAEIAAELLVLSGADQTPTPGRGDVVRAECVSPVETRAGGGLTEVARRFFGRDGA